MPFFIDKHSEAHILSSDRTRGLSRTREHEKVEREREERREEERKREKERERGREREEERERSPDDENKLRNNRMLTLRLHWRNRAFLAPVKFVRNGGSVPLL